MNRLWMAIPLAVALAAGAGCMHKDMDDKGMMKDDGMKSMSDSGMHDEGMKDKGMKDEGMKDEGMMDKEGM